MMNEIEMPPWSGRRPIRNGPSGAIWRCSVPHSKAQHHSQVKHGESALCLAQSIGWTNKDSQTCTRTEAYHQDEGPIALGAPLRASWRQATCPRVSAEDSPARCHCDGLLWTVHLAGAATSAVLGILDCGLLLCSFIRMTSRGQESAQTPQPLHRSASIRSIAISANLRLVGYDFSPVLLGPRRDTRAGTSSRRASKGRASICEAVAGLSASSHRCCP